MFWNYFKQILKKGRWNSQKGQVKVLPLTRSLAVTITSFMYGCWLYNVEYLKIQKNVLYRIDANTTADSINSAPRIN